VTDTAWEHQREVREALQTIVSDPQLGMPALSGARAMSNLLKDLLPDAPRETSVLVAAAEAGLAQILLDHVNQGMDTATAASLAASIAVSRMSEEGADTEALARTLMHPPAGRARGPLDDLIL
jgi:hypothetical protein